MSEKNYDFRKKLLRIHKPIELNHNNPLNNHLVLKSSVKIFLYDWNNEVMSTAVLDFIDFLKTAFGIKAVPTEKEENAHIKVGLSKDADVDLGDAKSYRGFMVNIDEKSAQVWGHDDRGAAQGLYYMEDLMYFEGVPALPLGTTCKKPMFSPQMIHSGYGQDEYPDNYLARVAHEGRDAILVFVKDVNKTPTGYLDFNDLIRRAARYGIDVYAYSKLHSDKNPEEPDAEEYYENTYGRLFRECPGLRGVTLVGESVEFPSNDPHVYKGHYYDPDPDGIPTGKESPGWYPCEDYPIWLNMIKKVIRKYNKDADIVFWTYNWGFQPEEARIKLIENLPTDISLQATYEMFEPRKYGESTSICADYTLSFEGPGKYFESEAKAAKKRGINLYSMTNTGGLTWDVGVIPYEPMPLQWIKRYETMRKAHKEWGLCGIMETHHYGFYPSIISKLSKWCFWSPEEDMSEVLRKILIAEYGEENYKSTLSALENWSNAIRYYTPTNSDQYGAFRVGPSYPLAIDNAPKIPENPGAIFGGRICKTDYIVRLDDRCTPVGVRIHDELASLKKMLEFMDAGIKELENTPFVNSNLSELLNMGKFIRNTVVTGIHAKEWHILKCRLNCEKSKEDIKSVLDEMVTLLENERENVKSTIPLVENDSRLGWEPSMLYMTDKWHLEWKLRHIDYVFSYEVETLRKSLLK